MRNLSFVLICMASCLNALTPGTYADWIWDTDYHAPEMPADRLNPTYSNCISMFGTEKECGKIAESDASEEEKRYLMLQMYAGMNNDTYAEAANEWNENVDFGRYSPGAEGMSGYDGNSIRNAWIVMLIPGVEDESGRTWIRNGTEISERHNIEMVIEKLEMSGACRISYDIKGYDYEIEAFADGQKIDGNILILDGKKYGDIVNVEEKMTFMAEWSADVYRMKSVEVCEKDEEGATQCRTEKRCKYDHTEVYKESGEASQTRQFYCYDENFNASNYMEGSEGWFYGAFPEGEALEFIISSDSLGNISYLAKLSGYELVEDEEMKPYAVLKARTAQISGESGTGMLLLRGASYRTLPDAKQSLVLEEMNGSVYSLVNYRMPNGYANATDVKCCVVFNSHFSNFTGEIPCGYDPNLKADINITLENVSENENITLVKIKFFNPMNNQTFGGKEIGFTYNYTSFNITTDDNGEAEFVLNNTIDGAFLSARFETDLSVPSAKTRIFVDGKPFDIGDLSGIIAVGLLGSGYFLAYRRFMAGAGGIC